ncbi:calcium-binding protein [Nostoc sp. DedQUE02]|uniref:calcium-binding protein n=1 Tax=Nostoc sp. DedQUE02 TaxID=3075388 RepID=UPI002AD2534C|nr:calcium-binding protein [Nostoc sp. DedQUE03]MDZ7974808.1 calcium-binding protein [Nostoc sp. DedQUE03]MDZ8045015.1 calcium-binding protein [Nostoc sp. DedQUE02]
MATFKGTNGNDVLNGTASADIIYGYEGNDSLSGGASNDTLDGGTGNDTLKGGVGNDIYIVDTTEDIVSEDNGSGGDAGGIDTVKSSVSYTLGNYIENLILTGTTAINGYGNALNNVITGNSANNYISGGDGNDSLYGLEGDDTLIGEAGNDKLYGGEGNDSLSGGEGDNSLYGDLGNDILNISSSSGKNLLDGGSGNDYFYAQYSTGNNTLKGGTGNDNFDIYYSSGNNLLDGGSENDIFYATNPTGSNTLNGGDDNDSFYFNAPSTAPSSLVTQTVDGGADDDFLSLNYGNYNIEGITSTFNATTKQGLITAGTYRVSYKNIERLNLYGTANADTIVGSNGDDNLNGYDGNDLLIGGKGNDILYGGSGTDTFTFNTYNQSVDSLYDFDTTGELIQVSAAGFGGGLVAGTVSAGQFTINSGATTDAQRFIYNNSTGQLFFDKDGSGAAFIQVQFAQLNGGLSLSEANFVVVA